MAVMISVKAGHDPAYYTATVGSGKQADYYLARLGSRASRRARGSAKGLADLGIHDGDDRERGRFSGDLRGVRQPSERVSTSAASPAHRR